MDNAIFHQWLRRKPLHSLSAFVRTLILGVPTDLVELYRMAVWVQNIAVFGRSGEFNQWTALSASLYSAKVLSQIAKPERFPCEVRCVSEFDVPMTWHLLLTAVVFAAFYGILSALLFACWRSRLHRL